MNLNNAALDQPQRWFRAERQKPCCGFLIWPSQRSHRLLLLRRWLPPFHHFPSDIRALSERDRLRFGNRAFQKNPMCSLFAGIFIDMKAACLSDMCGVGELMQVLNGLNHFLREGDSQPHGLSVGWVLSLPSAVLFYWRHKHCAPVDVRYHFTCVFNTLPNLWDVLGQIEINPNNAQKRHRTGERSAHMAAARSARKQQRKKVPLKVTDKLLQDGSHRWLKGECFTTTYAHHPPPPFFYFSQPLDSIFPFQQLLSAHTAATSRSQSHSAAICQPGEPTQAHHKSAENKTHMCEPKHTHTHF